MSEWRPIKTAPKDGTEILCITGNNTMYVVCYDNLFSSPWRVVNGFGLTEETPTHWMPIPEPPK